MVVIMQNTQKPIFVKTKVNATKITKVRGDGNKFRTAWERMEAIGSVVEAVGRLLWSGRQTKCLQLTKFLKFDNFNSKARFRLFE